jgi:hypothetical protein
VTIKYYLCRGCNLTFKDLSSAIDHRMRTMHGDVYKEYFVSRCDPFPPVILVEKDGRAGDVVPDVSGLQNSYPIGESELPPDEKKKEKEFYECLTCRLTFKNRAGAAEHRVNSNHKLIKQNYPIGPPTLDFYVEPIIGSNVDYAAFFQRMIDDVPNED